MCNLYAMMRGRAEVAALARAMIDRNNNQPPQPGIFPDYTAPVVVSGPEGQREIRDMRWGMPSSKKALLDAATKRADKLRAKDQAFDFNELLKMEPDKGTTNIRNTASRHWQPWLGAQSRCLVPFTSFCEPDQVGGSLQPVWFALAQERPIAFFAGVWTPWGCVRKIKTGWEDCELFGFLTTDANAEVATYHSKAMPVIFTEPADWDHWLSGAPWEDVRHLQRPLPGGALTVVAQDVRKDEFEPA